MTETVVSTGATEDSGAPTMTVPPALGVWLVDAERIPHMVIAIEERGTTTRYTLKAPGGTSVDIPFEQMQQQRWQFWSEADQAAVVRELTEQIGAVNAVHGFMETASAWRRNSANHERMRSESWQRASAAEQALSAFKDQVKEVAMRYADKHDWCEVVAKALRELDINVSRTVTVRGTFSTTMTVEWGQDLDDIDTGDVLEQMESYELDITSAEYEED